MHGLRSCARASLRVSAAARRAWSWTSDLVVLRLTSGSVSVMGLGVFGAIPGSGSASESQSQTRGTSIVRRVVGYVSGWREQLL